MEGSLLWVLFLIHNVYLIVSGDKRDCSVFKSTNQCPEFNSQQPHGGSQPSVMGFDALFCVSEDSNSVLTYIKYINLKKQNLHFSEVLWRLRQGWRRWRGVTGSWISAWATS